MGRIAAMLKNAGWVLIGTDMFVLAAMVTPAVMILATSSLILTTTNRLVRVVDRVREMLPEFEALASSDSPDNPKMAMLFDDLHRATVRARVGQQALAQLYLGLGAFVATSIALGVMTFARLDAGWMPLLFGAVGVALLFSASVLLIVESRIALASAYAEMDYIRRITSHLAQPELRKTRRWRMFRQGRLIPGGRSEGIHAGGRNAAATRIRVNRIGHARCRCFRRRRDRAACTAVDVSG
jgi:hypothetical protein